MINLLQNNASTLLPVLVKYNANELNMLSTYHVYASISCRLEINDAVTPFLHCANVMYLSVENIRLRRIIFDKSI
jgi:hypothetical protein